MYMEQKACGFYPSIFPLSFLLVQNSTTGFPGGSVVKNLPAEAGAAGDAGLIPGSGRSFGGENGNPLKYSCLENSMDREAW